MLSCAAGRFYFDSAQNIATCIKFTTSRCTPVQPPSVGSVWPIPDIECRFLKESYETFLSTLRGVDCR
jgi:hypothetical protein